MKICIGKMQFGLQEASMVSPSGFSSFGQHFKGFTAFATMREHFPIQT